MTNGNEGGNGDAIIYQFPKRPNSADVGLDRVLQTADPAASSNAEIITGNFDNGSMVIQDPENDAADYKNITIEGIFGIENVKNSNDARKYIVDTIRAQLMGLSVRPGTDDLTGYDLVANEINKIENCKCK